jgi:hypothetical protein
MKTEVSLDRGEKLIVVKSSQDVEPILEHNKVLQGIPQKSDWGRHVATVPNVILAQWLNEAHARGNTSMKLFDEEFMQMVWQKLNDCDWLFLRTDR